MASATAVSRGTSTPSGTRGGPRSRAESALRLAAPALLGYGAARALGIGLLWYVAGRRGQSAGRALYGSWDARWYQSVVDHGYDHTVWGTPHTWHAWSNLAFFPLYPALCEIAAALTPLSVARASWLVAMAASVAAAWLIFLIGNRLYRRRTGVILAVLWGCLPHAVVESMAYTESLFTALSAAALLAALSRRWIWAGAFAALAGLTRPTGIATAAAIALAAGLAALRAGRGAGRPARHTSVPPAARAAARTGPRVVWRPVLGAALAPTGWLAFVVWVGVRLHRADGYFAVQRAWGNRFSKGGYLPRRIRWVFLGPRGGYVPVAYVVVTLVVVVSFALFALCLVQRQALPLLLFSGALLAVLTFGSGVYIARARFLLPGFPLLIPFARVLARAHPRTIAFALGTAAVASAVYGVHLSLVWYGPP